MGEDEKIRQVIKKYDGYFKNCSGDVAYTATGYWVFFEYDSVSDDYYGFIRFETAEKLERIILNMLSDDVSFALENAAENIYKSFRRLDDEIYKGQDMDDVTRLTRQLELIREEYYKKSENLELLFKILSGALGDKL